MVANRRAARIVGVLFLISTASYLIGSGQIDALLGKTDYLAQFDSNRTNVYVSLLLEFINAAAVVGIAMYLFPILKLYNEFISLGYLISRIVESVLLIGSIAFLLILLPISQEFVAGSGSVGSDYFLTLGTLAIKGKTIMFELAMLALSIGSMMLCYLLYRTKLVPRPLSLLGIVGYIALLVSSCLSLSGFDPGVILFIPGGIFELVFPLWLIVKGLSEAK